MSKTKLVLKDCWSFLFIAADKLSIAGSIMEIDFTSGLSLQYSFIDSRVSDISPVSNSANGQF